jgi:hypothetical protein
MATVHASLNQPPKEAEASIRRQAGRLGYALAEGQSGPGLLMFTRGVTFFSWGSKVTVKVEPKATGSQLTLTTDESFAITDWGRGKRAAGKLLDAIGAQEE